MEWLIARYGKVLIGAPDRPQAPGDIPWAPPLLVPTWYSAPASRASAYAQDMIRGSGNSMEHLGEMQQRFTLDTRGCKWVGQKLGWGLV